MAHSIIDEIEYGNLTGDQVDESQSARFHAVAEAAVSQLETLLGWPLVPDSWDNQYIEIGKSKSNLSCPVADAELDPPDAVVNSYRLFTLQEGDPWLAIDPATEIHSVKYISGNITCVVYDEDKYIKRYQNGNPTLIKYLGIKKLMCTCVRIKEQRQFAVDADWAYAEDDDGNATIPTELKKVLADMIAEELDPKSNIKSESVVSHSYTKFDNESAVDRHIDTIRKYAGPHGTATRRLT